MPPNPLLHLLLKKENLRIRITPAFSLPKVHLLASFSSFFSEISSPFFLFKINLRIPTKDKIGEEIVTQEFLSLSPNLTPLFNRTIRNRVKESQGKSLLDPKDSNLKTKDVGFAWLIPRQKRF